MRTPGFRGARWQQCSIKYIGIAASAVATVLGIGLAVFKPLSLNSALVIAGAITLAAGIIKICGYFAGDMYCLAYQYDFAMGTLAIAAGALMIIRGENGYSCAALGALAAADCMHGARGAFVRAAFMARAAADRAAGGGGRRRTGIWRTGGRRAHAHGGRGDGAVRRALALHVGLRGQARRLLSGMI